MRRFLCFLFVGLGVQFAGADGFNDFITLVNITPGDQRQALVDSLMADLPGGRAPITEADRAWFLYQGTASSLAIAGDMNGWNPNISLNLISGTDLWYRGFLCEPDARLDYKLVRNGSQWLLDPLNPATCAGGFGPNSELAMPDYVQPPEIANHGLPEGSLHVWPNVWSPQLANNRTIRLLTPPDYVEGETRDLCIVHDGQDYLALAYLARVCAWLEDQHPGLSLPVFVCVPPVNRSEEYDGSQQQAFGEFITQTVLPMALDSLDMSGEPEHLMTMGASSGGDISAYLAGAYPELFDMLILMSPYLPVEQQQLLAARDPATLKIYMNWGSYDIPLLLPLIEESVQIFNEGGFDHLSRMYHEGHSWGLWRATIDEALLFLYDVDTTVGEARTPLQPGELELRAWPNPFNGLLRVEQPGGMETLRVWNLRGQLVEELGSAGLAGEWTWRARGLSSGSYLLEASGRAGVRRTRVLFMQ